MEITKEDLEKLVVTPEVQAACLAAVLNGILTNLHPDLRIQVRDVVMEGFCDYCGTHNLPCYCMRDD